MAPLGFPVTLIGGIGDLGGVVLSEMNDVCFWQDMGSCELAPKALGTVLDLTNDVWDLVTVDGEDNHYTLEDPSGLASSCFWDLDGNTDECRPNDASIVRCT